MLGDRRDGPWFPSGESERSQGAEGEKPLAPPFVPDDNRSAAMAAIFARRRRWRASRAVLDSGVIGPPIAASIAGSSAGIALGAPGTLIADASVLPDWTALRAEIIPRLDALDAGFHKLLEAYREQAGQIGHNNPPELINLLPLDRAELEMGVAAANLTRIEINAEQPRSEVMGLCVQALTCIAGYCDTYLKSAADEAGKRTVQGVALISIITQLHAGLADVVTKICHVFELLHLTF